MIHQRTRGEQSFVYGTDDLPPQWIVQRGFALSDLKSFVLQVATRLVLS